MMWKLLWKYLLCWKHVSHLSQVPCPNISDPAEKYMSLIIPAFNEELRLPGALDETMK